MPFGHLVNGRSVDSEPHDGIPPLSSHHSKHGQHRSAHIVKVSFRLDPLSAIVVAVPLRKNLLLGTLWNVLHIAGVHLASKEVDTLNTEEHQ